jgi:hypothetical protein
MLFLATPLRRLIWHGGCSRTSVTLGLCREDHLDQDIRQENRR